MSDTLEAGLEPLESAEMRAPDDPVVRWLLFAVFGMLIVCLTVVGYLVWYAMSPKVPRTSVELQVSMLSQATKANPKAVETWAKYVHSLTVAERYGDADSALTDARKAVGKKAVLTVEEGRLLLTQGRATDAISVLSKAANQARAEQKAKEDEIAKKGVRQKIASPELTEAEVLLGDAYLERGRAEDAAAAYSAALEEDPTMSDVLVARGDVYATLKRYADARKDYETAAKFVPGFKPAAAGLAKLKAVGK